jgi:hypothetical protein
MPKRQSASASVGARIDSVTPLSLSLERRVAMSSLLTEDELAELRELRRAWIKSDHDQSADRRHVYMEKLFELGHELEQMASELLKRSAASALGIKLEES